MRLERISEYCTGCGQCDEVFPGLLDRLEKGPVRIGFAEITEAFNARRACKTGALQIASEEERP